MGELGKVWFADAVLLGSVRPPLIEAERKRDRPDWQARWPERDRASYAAIVNDKPRV